MMGPLPVVAFIGCTQGPPEAPPDRPQLGNHQSAVPLVVRSSAQYMKLGSSL